ncbi:hypothetical protein [Gordonia sp. 852002-10350_SCH5691597]|uniref:hypothetical protein n=1 Tax=Gordonia sp. 852002-10350_SCH5691597 TaxID=1834085 RepID=UPI001E5AA3C8|nr:hypothetical protein [Gordonia sp. 852002-10350_SCH5691597]
MSAGIALVFAVLYFAVEYAIYRFKLFDWWSFSGLSVLILLYVCVLGIWGRSTPQRILGPLVALGFLGLQRGLDGLFLVIGPDLYSGWTDAEFTTWFTAGNALCLFGVAAGWSLARRRTFIAFLGIIPAVAVCGLGGWAEQSISYPHSYLWASLLDTLVFFGLAVLAIMCVWACDGLGLAVRGRSRQQPGPYPQRNGYPQAEVFPSGGTSPAPGSNATSPYPHPAAPPSQPGGWPPH